MPDAIPIPDPYRVQRGDTLPVIARRSGRTVTELRQYNEIANPHRLEVGQILYLSKATAFGVSILFLDTLRHPIENLPYRLLFDGKQIQGVTDSTGAVLNQIVTRNAQSMIEIWIMNADKQWQQIARTRSDHGHKRITHVSGFIVINGQTEKLPHGAPPKPEIQPPAPPPASGPQAPMPPRPTGTPSKNNPQIKTKTDQGPQGQSVITVGIDLPEGLLQYFQNYTGEEITERDWKLAAGTIECEVEVLKAFAQVETKGAAFVRINASDQSGIMPAILYERHTFHRLTCANGPHVNTRHHRYHGEKVAGCHSPHDGAPDICYPSPFVPAVAKGHKTLHTANPAMPTDRVEVTDQYGSRSYLRLLNAYRHNADAALKACSWGKFQIMGDEHMSSCGFQDIKDFMTAMCTSEVRQIELFRRFIENKAGGRLLKAVRKKDWANMARYYNGSGNVEHYADLLRKAYENIKKTTA